MIDRSALRWVLLARLVLGSLLLGAALALRYTGTADFISFRFTPIYAYAGAIYASSSLLGVWYAWRGGLPGWGLAGISAIDLTLVFGLTTYTGGSQSPFLFLYIFIIIGAAVLRLRRGALIVTALSMIMLGLTLLIESNGKLPLTYIARYQRSTNSELLITAFYNISAFYIVGILGSYLGERLRSAGEEINRLDLDISILRGLQERIIDSVASGLMTLDELGRVLIANKQAERILGLPVAKLRGRMAGQVLPGIALGETAADSRLELAYTHPEGGARFLGYSVSPIPLDARRVGSIVIFQDLTRMKQLESEVKRQEKLAALGSMAAGIAHEIRNPLGSISGSLQLLTQRGSLDDDERQLFGIALREIDRLNKLVSDFLQYARPQRRPAGPLAARPLVDEVLEGLRNAASGAAFENRVPEGVTLLADAHSFKQVILNLLLNAAQAGARHVIVSATAAEGRVRVDVEDDGPGIAAEALPRLFEPFFTTRPDGVGLGLAIVYRLMEELQGSVRVESSPGRTVMHLFFPAAEVVA